MFGLAESWISWRKKLPSSLVDALRVQGSADDAKHVSWGVHPVLNGSMAPLGRGSMRFYRGILKVEHGSLWVREGECKCQGKT